MSNQLSIDFSGKTIVPHLDNKRLAKQLLRVLDFMVDFPGWHTLAEISAHTNDPESSISARLRQIDGMGTYQKIRRRVEGHPGLHEYALVRRVSQ